MCDKSGEDDEDKDRAEDKIRDDYGEGQRDKQMLDKLWEARLRWDEHVLRRDSEYNDGRMLRMEMPGRRPWGRATQKFMDVVKDDMKLVGVNAEGWVRWRQLIHFGDAWGEQPKLEKEKDSPRFLKNKFINVRFRVFFLSYTIL